MVDCELFLEILNSCLESEFYTRQILLGIEVPVFQMDNEVTELTGIEQIHLLKCSSDDNDINDNDDDFYDEDILSLKVLRVYGNTDLINFYFHILNSKYFYHVDERDKIYITSVGNQKLELNSLSALFCYYDVKFVIDSSVYPFFKNLYKYKTFRDLGNSLSYKSYTEFYNFIVDSNMYLDCIEIDMYDSDELMDFFMLFIGNDTLNHHIKSFNIILRPMFFDGSSDIEDIINFVEKFDKLNLFKFYTHSSVKFEVKETEDFLLLSKHLPIEYLDIDIYELDNNPNNIYSVLDKRYY